MDYEFSKDEKNQPIIKTGLTDYALLSHSLLNKGTAFTESEREAFGLVGLLPPFVTNIHIQLTRSYQIFQSKPSDIEKYIYLRELLDSNETLFHRLVLEHIEELMPIVYTPTVGLGCQRYSQIYRRPRGVFISYPDRNRIDQILATHRFDHVKIIVVSDGERILGLGDQGAGGMGIPIGKLALYSVCAGIHPAFTLPVLLDTGTNNPLLQTDPLYIGWHHERIRGQEYLDFIDQFIKAVKKRFPHVILQWEDFAQANANTLLTRYRDELCTFNDDIQGSAAATTSALLAAIRVTGIPLKEQKFVIVGAGSAGCGISQLLQKMLQQTGMSENEACKHFYLIDRFGLLLDDAPLLFDFQKPFAQSKDSIHHWQLENTATVTLKDVIKNVHPTILIGAAGQPGIFTEDIVREMAAHVAQPIIFPLSNPTERSEAIPSDLLQWTEERAVIGTGSPFNPVIKHGRLFRVDQTNNAYIFPGLGLGLMSVHAKKVTDRILMAGAYALYQCSPAKSNPYANLLPAFTQIREVSLRVALAVAEEAIRSGLAEYHAQESLVDHIKKMMWMPEYLLYNKVNFNSI